MISKGSKQNFNNKSVSGLGSMNTCNTTSNYNNADRTDETECESLLEKDIQVTTLNNN